MRKLFVVSVIICLVAGAILLVGGCGQSNPTINTSNPQAQGLKLIGVVRSTTLNGTVGDPIAGAYVSISGDSVNRTVVTNSNGEYVFENIPDGDYTFVATAEGHTRDTLNWTLVKPGSGIPADNTITVTDIQLGSNPIVLSYSPTPMSVVGNLPTIVVTFNEAMDTSSVVPTLTAAGIRTMVTGPSTVPLAGTWDDTANPRILTLVPQADLISNEVYTLAINGTAMDAAGYAISTTPEQAQELSPEFRVTCGGVPGTPGGLSIVCNSKPITNDATAGANYSDAVTSGNIIGIYWTPSSGVVTGYKVYVANSATGNYHLISAVSPTTNFASPTVANILTALYNGTIDTLGTANFPLINVPLYVKVVAFNGDGESGGGYTSAKELIGPQMNTSVQKAPYTGGTLNNNYHLPALASNNDVYVGVIEPIDPSSVSTTNFTISGGVTVNSVTLMTRGSSDLGFFAGSDMSILLIQTDTDLTVGGPRTLTASGLYDLAGNAMQVGVGDTVAIP